MNGGAQADNEPNSKVYKTLPTADMQDTNFSLSKEVDGADEKMLPKDEEKNVKNHKAPILEKLNGDTKLEICDLKSAFVGMGKEELMRYVNDPFWIKVRWILFVGFWIVWSAMLLGAIYLIYAAPKCTPPRPKTWWEKSPLTQVESDFNVDDLDQHVKGAIVTWPDDPYSKIDQSHDVLKFVNSLKAKGTNVILELDPTGSNVWFEESEARHPLYSEYYIWKSGSNRPDGLPNNWVSPNNRSSWKFSAERDEHYYAPFDRPHLNFHNKDVVNEFSKVIANFLSMNVSGIRLKNAAFLLVDSKMDDQTPRPIVKGAEQGLDLTKYGFYDTAKTEYRPELAYVIKQWHDLIRNITKDGPLMVAEEIQKPAAFKVNDSLVVDLPLLEHVFSKVNFSVAEVANNLNVTFKADRIEWPLWKASTRALPKDVLDMITYLLPGTPLIDQSDVLDKELLKIRESPSIMRGTTDLYRLKNDTVFGFIRIHSESPGVLVLVNPGNETVIVDLSAEVPLLHEVTEMTVKLWSSGYEETELMDEGGKKPTTAIPVSGKSGIIFEYVPKKKDGEVSH